MAELTKTTIKSIYGSSGSIRKLINPNVPGSPLCDLYIQYKGTLYRPVVEEGIVWETERKGAPGKLTFAVFQDGKLKFSYGSIVAFKYNNRNVFYGFIFKITPRKDGFIEMLAYDQLRYFTNKHTYVYKNKRLDQIVRMIASDFKLHVGSVANTGRAISRVEDNTALFDIVANAMDDTVLATGNLFVLYDDFGKLNLRNISSMKMTHLIDKETARDYDYSGSIDENSYSKVVIYHDEDGVREYYIAQSETLQNSWGVLQLTEKAGSRSTAKQQAKLMLDMYSKPTRSLSVREAFGNVKVRAGCLVPVMLQLADIKVSNYMLVEKATHTFKESDYTMDLSVVGNTFAE